MKTSKKTGKSAAASKPKKGEDVKNRKMEPMKSKELKNQRFDIEDEDDDLDAEIIDENFKGFDDFYEAEEDDDE